MCVCQRVRVCVCVCLCVSLSPSPLNFHSSQCQAVSVCLTVHGAHVSLMRDFFLPVRLSFNLCVSPFRAEKPLLSKNFCLPTTNDLIANEAALGLSVSSVSECSAKSQIDLAPNSVLF